MTSEKKGVMGLSIGEFTLLGDYMLENDINIEAW